jgi:fumarate hydratase class I
MKRLTTPISEADIRELKVGDEVLLNGRVVLSRDMGHKYMVEHKPEWLRPLLEESVIYHCGPVVAKHEDGTYSFVAAGPTTSIREEPYEATVLETYTVRGVIGKGGMGP